MKGHLKSNVANNIILANKYFHKKLCMIECLTIPHIISAPQIKGNFFIAVNNLLPCITLYRSIYWVNKCHLPCLNLNFLSFDTKHDIVCPNETFSFI